MLEAILQEGLKQLHLPFTEETLKRFRTYYTLLEERNHVMNLTAVAGEEDVARLHFLDCAALLPFFLPDSPAGAGVSLLDVGSGPGFPGLVLKLLYPGLSLTLLDSQRKRVDFQQELCEALGLEDVRCLHLRAEDAPTGMRESFDCVTSRAVARLNVLSELCLPFVKAGGRFLAMKGPAAEEELAEAEKALRLLGGGEASLTGYTVPGLDARRSLISVVKVSPTPKRYPRRFAQIKKQPL